MLARRFIWLLCRICHSANKKRPGYVTVTLTEEWEAHCLVSRVAPKLYPSIQKPWARNPVVATMSNQALLLYLYFYIGLRNTDEMRPIDFMT